MREEEEEEEKEKRREEEREIKRYETWDFCMELHGFLKL